MRNARTKTRISLIVLLMLFESFYVGVLRQSPGISEQVKPAASLKYELRRPYTPISIVAEVERKGGTTKENERFFARTERYEAKVSNAGLLSIAVGGVDVIKEGGLFLKYNDVSESLNLSKVMRANDKDQNTIVTCGLHSKSAGITKKYTFYQNIPSVDVEVTIRYKSTISINEERIFYKTQLKNVKGLDHKSQFRSITGQNVWTGRIPAYVSFHDESGYDRSFHLLGNSEVPLTIIDIQHGYSMIHFYMDSERVHPHFFFRAVRPKLDYTELFLVKLWRMIVSHDGISYNQKRRIHPHSASIGDKGTTRVYKFGFWFGKSPHFIRKQLQPFGREATLVWTEHADAQCTKSVQAVYLGTSDESSPDYGKKGFVGNNLRVSKTVFAYSEGRDMGLDVPEFRHVIDVIYQNGIEIGPHTMTPRKDGWLLNLGFEIFQRYYKSRFWIDHGCSSGEENHEGLTREGWDHSSDSYILDKLDDFGYEYVWAYWDQGSEAPKSFNFLYPENMDQIPLMLWHLNRLDHNRTDEKRIFLFNGYSKRGKRDYYAPDVIDKLIAERGVHLSHNYFCLVPSETVAPHYKDQFFSVRGEVYEINETFESYLRYIKQKVNEGKLWNPTISEWGDYIRALQNIQTIYLNDQNVIITNNNAVSIPGFSLAILGVTPSEISVTGANIIGHKQVDNDLILWFDMLGAQKLKISIEKVK